MKMAKFFFVFSFLLFAFHSSAYESTAKHYVVYMGSHAHALPNSTAVINSNYEMLGDVIGGVEKARRSIVHHYHKSFRGFSAMLTPEEADNLSKKRSVVSVFESKRYHLQTTRSWDFMLEQVENGGAGKGLFDVHRSRIKGPNHDVIIGHFDSGVWPESSSFSDRGFGPVPDYFRGECIPGDQFPSNTCNRKIIGARYYYQGYESTMGPLEDAGRTFYRSARDDFSHGSHTASTAAGVPSTIGQNLFIQGGAPGARLSVYKVCWFNYCDSSDVLKAFDDAIQDNVDVITFSICAPSPENYFGDVFSIGAFHAFKNRIVAVASAGNMRSTSSVVNVAPWMITVAASTIDREFINYIHLGSGQTIQGYGLNNVVPGSSYPLVMYTSNYPEERYCNTLDSAYTYDKIVVCYMEAGEDTVLGKAEIVREAGGVGLIIIGEGDVTQILYAAYPVPISVIGQREGLQLEQYMTTSSNPYAIISPSEAALQTKPAPSMAYFSKQGPNAITPDLIKPDITAPGFNIYAAFPGGTNTFGIDSGTSMSAPHVTGVASVIQATNKRWSVAAIKSAIMTTAIVHDNTGGPIKSGAGPATPFDFGSGHLEPDLALSPGLVYDFDENDLVDFLCYHIRYYDDYYKLSNMVGRNVVCKSPPVPPYQLNYPSIAISQLDRPISVRRTLTFVASRNGPKVYTVSMENPAGVDVTVEPKVLDFSDGKENLSYTLHFTPRRVAPGYAYTFGSITWSDGHRHRVRSPIAVRIV